MGDFKGRVAVLDRVGNQLALKADVDWFVLIRLELVAVSVTDRDIIGVYHVLVLCIDDFRVCGAADRHHTA